MPQKYSLTHKAVPGEGVYLLRCMVCGHSAREHPLWLWNPLNWLLNLAYRD